MEARPFLGVILAGLVLNYTKIKLICMTKQILITAGGTGGHVFSIYSLANYLVEENLL